MTTPTYGPIPQYVFRFPVTILVYVCIYVCVCLLTCWVCCWWRIRHGIALRVVHTPRHSWWMEDWHGWTLKTSIFLFILIMVWISIVGLAIGFWLGVGWFESQCCLLHYNPQVPIGIAQTILMDNTKLSDAHEASSSTKRIAAHGIQKKRCHLDYRWDNLLENQKYPV